MKKEMQQRKPNRLKNFDYSASGAYFITICTKDKQKILSRVVGTGVLDCPQIELTQVGKIAEKYIKQLGDFYKHISVDDFVIMPNHIHIMLTVKERNNGQSGTPVPTSERSLRANSVYAQFVSTFKRFSNKEYGKNIWQERSYDHIIRDYDDYTEHLRYILENPARWESDELFV